MIHHISIPAQNPLKVANGLAEICKAKVYPFPPVAGAYIVVNDDQKGTAIEIYPLNTKITTTANMADKFIETDTIPSFTAFHAAISVTTTPAEIEAVANREGWLVQVCDNRPFPVIELWVENWLMLEFLTPEFADQYIKFMQPKNLETFLVNNH